MRIKLQHLTEHLHGFLLILGITAFLASIIFPSEYLIYFFHSFILLIPFCTTAWAQKHVKHLLSYLLLGLAGTAAVFLLGMNFFEQLYLTVLAAVIMLARIPSRLHDSPGLLDAPGPGFLGYFVLLFFVALLLKQEAPQTLVYWLTFVYLADYLLFLNLTHLNGYLHSRRDSANLPGHQIVSTNRALMTLFFVLVILFMLVLPLVPLDRVVSAIGIALRDFLRWIFSHFSEEEQAIMETAAQTLAAEAQTEGFAETAATPAWLQMLYDILFGVITFVVCTAAIAGLIYAIILLFHRFYRPMAENGDTQEFIDEKADDLFIREQKDKKREPFLSSLFHPSMIVRRRFKKQIRKGTASGTKGAVSIPEPLTPSELEEYAGLPDSEETRRLHELYEKARYSREGCTKEEAASLK